MEPTANPSFTHLFLHLLHSAQFDPRGAARFVRRHTRANVFVNQHGEVGLNFLVEVYIHTSRVKEISQEASGFHKERHD
jgi:hypothetical protein